MPVIRDHAVILARIDYSETSQIISAFTRNHGKVRAIAKGVKRGTKTRFAAGIDLLDIAEIVVTSREERPAGLATLTEWKQSRGFLGLREKLFRLYGAQYVAEIANALTEDWDPHEGLYDDLLDALSHLDMADEPFKPVVRFQITLLHSIGSMPRFDTCATCGRAGELTHFSSFDGGTICRHCEPVQVEKRAISNSTVEMVLRLHGTLVSREVEKSGAAAESNLIGPFDILDYHISHLMGRAPVMAAKLLSPDRRRAAQQ